MKNPLLAEPGPRPSSLYMNAGLTPCAGASSLITLLVVSIIVLVISNGIFLPSTALEKPKTGTSVLILLSLYCSVGTPKIVALVSGLPNCLLVSRAELITLINCSYQLALVASFQVTVEPDKFLLLESMIASVVLTLVNFKNPFPA